jgi:hypothetical protein
MTIAVCGWAQKLQLQVQSHAQGKAHDIDNYVWDKGRIDITELEDPGAKLRHTGDKNSQHALRL